ncbi:MAG: iron ABC transporter permease [Chloroflexi bacterium]|nr:MAG: iron ABC transporter permease [Chloroflexota bacterium]
MLLHPTRSRPALFLLMTCLLLAAGLFFPTAYLLVRASEVEAGRALDYLTRAATLRIMGRSLLLVVTVVLASGAVAIPAAWLTARTDLRGRRAWTVILTVPLVIPSYIGAFALIGAIGPRGMLQQALEPLGVERLPSVYGFWGAWLSITLFTYPYLFLSVRAGLRGLDPALEEASYLLGRSAWTTFRRVTLPMLAPSISAGALLVALYTLSDFGAVATMQYNVFTRVIYLHLGIDLDLAALLSTVLVGFTLLILVLSTLAERRGAYYTRRAPRVPRRIRLGRWQGPALLFCALITLLALVAPLAVMAYWLVNGLQHDEPIRDVLAPLQRSLRAAALGAAASGAIALPFALLQVRHPGRIGRLLAQVPYIGYALPGIVIGLAFVFVGANYLHDLNRLIGIDSYRTLPLLIAAYAVRFVPQAVGPARAALMQINPALEESALTLGRGPLRVFGTITLPLMRSGLVAGAALVFLTVMKELPVTLLLAPTGYDTLATRIWSASSESFYARAAAPALVLVMISALSLVYILDPDD